MKPWTGRNHWARTRMASLLFVLHQPLCLAKLV